MAVKLFGITYRNAFVSRACHGCRIRDIHIRCHCKRKKWWKLNEQMSVNYNNDSTLIFYIFTKNILKNGEIFYCSNPILGVWWYTVGGVLHFRGFCNIISLSNSFSYYSKLLFIGSKLKNFSHKFRWPSPTTLAY